MIRTAGARPLEVKGPTIPTASGCDLLLCLYSALIRAWRVRNAVRYKYASRPISHNELTGYALRR